MTEPYLLLPEAIGMKMEVGGLCALQMEGLLGQGYSLAMLEQAVLEIGQQI